MEAAKVKERIKNAIKKCVADENILWSKARIILQWQRKNELGLEPIFEIQLWESQRKIPKSLTLFELLGVTTMERLFINSEESLMQDLIKYFQNVCENSKPPVDPYKSLVMFFLYSDEMNLGIQLFSENKFISDVSIEELIK